MKSYRYAIAMLAATLAVTGCRTERPGDPVAPNVQPPYRPPTTWSLPAPNGTNIYRINIYCNEVKL